MPRRTRSSKKPVKKTSKKPAKKTTRSRRKSAAKSKSLGWLGWSLKWLVITGIWGSVAASLFVIWFAYDLPDVKRLKQATRQPGISILAQDGSLIATHGDIYGARVTVKSVPDYVPSAILAIEDHRYYQHFGVDLLGILRAMWSNYQAGTVVQGGSTITQQLAKNFLLSEKMYRPTDRSYRRKIQELLLAFWLEKKFSKEQILSIYLNRVYLGAGVFGVEAAAQKYFGKRARSLSLYEAAVLAGLLKAPSKLSPASNPERADARAQVVLDSMLEAGFITHHQRSNIKGSIKDMHQARDRRKMGRYFTDWIVETLPNYIGPIHQDVIVRTTLNPKLQRLAETQAKHIIEQNSSKYNVHQVALVAMTPAGAVKALVGGYDYYQSQFNRATQAVRQAGSAFKLFVYLPALELGMTPQTRVSDGPVRIGKWRPRNYKWQSRGQLTLTEAMAYSVNTPCVRVAAKVGKKRIAQAAYRLGIKIKQPNDLTVSLGTGGVTLIQLTGAYAAVANGGLEVKPYAITQVQDRYRRVLYRRQATNPPRVMTPQVAQQLSQMLSATMAYGTGRTKRLQAPCAGKTGTTQNHADAWFVGYAHQPLLVTGVWMGNDNHKLMKAVTGGGLPGQLWHGFMSRNQMSDF
ncbi:MAG: PBP1A family penicillin-binding protein [Pseudomonadota bacterium]